MSTEHELKAWPEPFAAVLTGAKRYEIRRADRDFKVGDVLWLREWQPERAGSYKVVGTAATWVARPAHYTGRDIRCRVTYMTHAGQWGVPQGLCVMSIEVIA
jgi:hypothetical protein